MLIFITYYLSSPLIFLFLFIASIFNKKIAEIKPAVDGFFDEVMVMVEDISLQNNRLYLLYQISGLFSGLADFSRIILKKG